MHEDEIKQLHCQVGELKRQNHELEQRKPEVTEKQIASFVKTMRNYKDLKDKQSGIPPRAPRDCGRGNAEGQENEVPATPLSSNILVDAGIKAEVSKAPRILGMYYLLLFFSLLRYLLSCIEYFRDIFDKVSVSNRLYFFAGRASGPASIADGH